MSRWRDTARQRCCLRVGHRGAAALAPQNTLLAFARALELGVDAIELDVRWTADRKLVVVHDEDLAETTNGRGLVRDHTLVEIETLDAGQGQHIPTLDEVLALVKGRALINVDLKILGYEEQVVRTLEAHGVQNDVLISSLLPENLRRVHAINPAILTALSYPEDKGGASKKPYLKDVVRVALALMRATLPWRIGRMVTAAQAGGAMLHHPLISRGVIDAVHRRSWLIGAWTVDRPEDMIRLRALGVDSITSNRPDLLMNIL